MTAAEKEASKKKHEALITDSRFHMANERTFLAWVRTSVGIMIFGFVVEKFALPARYLLGMDPDAAPPEPGPLVWLGLFLVLLGAAAALLATYRFIRTQKQILENTYKPSVVRYVLLAVLLSSIGVLVALHLADTLQLF